MSARAARLQQGERAAVVRWECRCQEPPVLLGTYDSTGKVNIKARDRYWHVIGRIWTTCPRCGAEHAFDPSAVPSQFCQDAESRPASKP
jgi:hypothetical protein